MNSEKTKKPLSRRSKALLITLGIIIVLCIIELVRSNSFIEVECFEYKNENIPGSFDGVKIVSVTDYHNHGGSYEDRLIEKIKEQDPDYIFLVGDIIDSRFTKLDVQKSFLEKCADIAPCYLCYGNHELRLDKSKLDEYNKNAENAGVTILDNELIPLTRGDDTLFLAGTTSAGGAVDISDRAEAVQKSAPLLWLHHYPENFEDLSNDAENMGFPSALFFSGHAHGGLIRIPFTRIGAVAPGQGILPEYTGGEYYCKESEMLLSRGCGNSGMTLRFFDPFEIVVCTLKSD